MSFSCINLPAYGALQWKWELTKTPGNYMECFQCSSALALDFFFYMYKAKQNQSTKRFPQLPPCLFDHDHNPVLWIMDHRCHRWQRIHLALVSTLVSEESGWEWNSTLLYYTSCCFYDHRTEHHCHLCITMIWERGSEHMVNSTGCEARPWLTSCLYYFLCLWLIYLLIFQREGRKG